MWSTIQGKIPSWTDPDISASPTSWGSAVYEEIDLSEVMQPSIWVNQPLMQDGSTRTDFFLVKFTGQIEVPYPGSWTFYLAVNDAGYLKINNNQVVENYCCHMITEASGTMLLTASKYDLEVRLLVCCFF